jgi:hypothetical protein
MQHDPPRATPHRRNKPFLGGTVAPEVAAAVEAEVQRTGRPRAHVIEARLRAAYGMPVEAPPATT